jgi:hypothetical protein
MRFYIGALWIGYIVLATTSVFASTVCGRIADFGHRPSRILMELVSQSQVLTSVWLSNLRVESAAADSCEPLVCEIAEPCMCAPRTHPFRIFSTRRMCTRGDSCTARASQCSSRPVPPACQLGPRPLREGGGSCLILSKSSG